MLSKTLIKQDVSRDAHLVAYLVQQKQASGFSAV